MLKVHFLNVGKGNCTVISFPSGNLAVIDIDNSKIDDETDSLQDPIEFLKSNYPNRSVFRLNGSGVFQRSIRCLYGWR